MAEYSLPSKQMNQLEIIYRELLVKLKTSVSQLDSQTDAMLCVKWVQKLQTFTEPNDLILRNYLLRQICNQIQLGYLGHPFVNLNYLDQDLNVVATSCREFEKNGTMQESLQTKLECSTSNTTNYESDVDESEQMEIQNSLGKPNGKYGWKEQNKPLINAFQSENTRQNFDQRKYRETLPGLKQNKLKLYERDTQSVEQFVEYLGANFIKKYQNAVDELLVIERSPNVREELLAFQLNVSSKFKSSCGDFLNIKVAENLLKAEGQFQRIFYRILSNIIENNECKKDLVSTDRGTISTDMELHAMSNTKYIEYLKRCIRKQQKLFNRKIEGYDRQIFELKNEISLRDKEQNIRIIEMKCQNMITNEQKCKDQLSESINELESKYKSIVQKLIDELRE